VARNPPPDKAKPICRMMSPMQPASHAARKSYRARLPASLMSYTLVWHCRLFIQK
jgi:hypothetical protein